MEEEEGSKMEQEDEEVNLGGLESKTTSTHNEESVDNCHKSESMEEVGQERGGNETRRRSGRVTRAPDRLKDLIVD